MIQWNVTWKVSRPLNKTSSNNSSFLALSAKKEVLLLLLLLCGTYLPLFLLCRYILLLMGNVEDCLPTPSTRALTNSAILWWWYHGGSLFSKSAGSNRGEIGGLILTNYLSQYLNVAFCWKVGWTILTIIFIFKSKLQGILG